MEQEKKYKEKSVLAKIAFISSLLGVGSIILFCFFVTLGMDFGIFVLLDLAFSALATLLGVLSLPIIIIFRRRLTSLVYSFLAILIAMPTMWMTTGILMTRNVRLESKKAHTALYNMELLAKELKKYAKNHDGCLPDANQWCDALMNENPELTLENFRHPKSDSIGLKGEYHIAFNKRLGGRLLSEVSPETVLLFEADGDWNLNGTTSLLRSRYNEELYIDILFVDGSIYSYWFDKKAVRKFKSEFGGRASMYYEKPRWKP